MFSIFRGKPSDFYHNHNFFNIKLTPDYTLDIRLPITRDHKINEKRQRVKINAQVNAFKTLQKTEVFHLPL